MTSYKTKKIKLAVKNLIEEASVHGLPKIIKSKRIITKAMWAFCFFLSSSACFYYSIKTLVDYLDYETITNVNVYSEIPTDFPTISLCSTFGSSFDSNFQNNMLKCLFNDNADCLKRPKDFFEPFNDTLYGRCFRFNSGRNYFGEKIDILRTNFRGKDHGLQLNLKVNSSNSSNIGALKLFIHNSTFRPTVLRNVGFTISAGSRVYIEITKHFISKLDEPYNMCLKNASLFKFNKTLIDYIKNIKENIYTQKYCLDLCFSLKYMENANCNCSETSFDFIYENCYLSAKDSLKDCTSNFTKNFYSQSVYDLCSEYCPAECDSFDYFINSHSFTFPDYGNISSYDQSAFFYSKFKKYQEVKQSFVSFYIYFGNLEYTLVSQHPKTELIDLISNVGGLLGLFTGFTFLSIADIIEIFMEIIFILNESNEIKPFNS